MIFHQRSNYFPTRDSNKKQFPKLTFLVIVFLIIIFSFQFSRNFIFRLANPFWNIKNSIVYFFQDNVSLLKSKSALIAENEKFKNDISELENGAVLSDVLKKENEDLKNILNRKTEQKLILATILVKPFLSLYDTLVIDLGIQDGVAVGDKILADGDVYIGYISEVYANSSKVVLYSSPGEKVKVIIGDNNVEKEAVGLGNGNFSVEMPREAGIKEGDAIVFPSISPNVFGVVEKVEFKETDSFENVLFKNPVNLSELKWVEVLPASTSSKLKK